MRALVESDVDGGYSAWLNDPEVNRFNSHGRFPKSQEELLNYVKSVRKNNTIVVLAVIDKTNNEHIGNISLQSISWIDRSADLAFLLGNTSYAGKGYMYDAGTLIIQHAFKILNFRRITCGTSSENIGMLKLAEKLGFKKEGIRREALYKHGTFYDIIEFGLMANEWD